MHQGMHIIPRQRTITDNERDVVTHTTTEQHQLLTISHGSSNHQIELPVSALMKGQYVDISEIGLVLATSSETKTSTKNEDTKSMDLTNLQCVRILGTHESDNTGALQPILATNNWGTTRNPQNESEVVPTRILFNAKR